MQFPCLNPSQFLCRAGGVHSRTSHPPRTALAADEPQEPGGREGCIGRWTTLGHLSWGALALLGRSKKRPELFLGGSSAGWAQLKNPPERLVACRKTVMRRQTDFPRKAWKLGGSGTTSLKHWKKPPAAWTLCPDGILFKMRVKDIFRQTKLASFVTGHTCTKGNSIKETKER